jgi:hypothetical protein
MTVLATTTTLRVDHLSLDLVKGRVWTPYTSEPVDTLHEASEIMSDLLTRGYKARIVEVTVIEREINREDS